MKIGLFGINTAVFSTREAITRVAQTADEAGYESLWTGEHVVAIDPQVPPSPIAPHTRMVDTVATLAFADERRRAFAVYSKRGAVRGLNPLTGFPDAIEGFVFDREYFYQSY